MRKEEPIIVIVGITILVCLVLGIMKFNTWAAEHGFNRQGVVVSLSSEDRKLFTEIRDALKELKR